MTSRIDLKLQQAEKLFNDAKCKDALDILDYIENIDELNENQKLACKTLKIRILIYTTKTEDAFNLSTSVIPKDFLTNKLLIDTMDIKRYLMLLYVVVLKAIALRHLGKRELSIQVLDKEEEILSTLEFDNPIVIKIKGDVKKEKGAAYYYQGKMDQALELFWEALNFYEEIDYQPEIGRTLEWIGEGLKAKGELELAFEYLENSLQIIKKLGLKYYLHDILTELGVAHSLVGELDQALEYHLESLEISKELKFYYGVSASYFDLANISRLKGDYEAAYDYCERSLKIRSKREIRIKYAESLYFMIIITVEMGLLEKAQGYLYQLLEVKELKKHQWINQLYEIAYALLLSKGNRVKNLAKAQEILKKVIDEDVIYGEVTVFAISTLCKLLLEEFHYFGNIGIITEFKKYIDRLLNIASIQKSYLLLTEVYLLQSRIALIDWDTDKAKELLTQASSIAKEKGLGKLTLEIAREQASLLREIETRDKFMIEKVKKVEVDKIAQLEESLLAIIQGKSFELAKQKEELSEFTHQMAHDLRRNLTNVLGFSEFIQKKGYSKRLMQKIVNNTKMMQDLVTHTIILAEAGLVVDSVDEVDLNHLVESVTIIHLPSDVVLTHNELPILVCDRNRVTQIFKNLFENAVIHGKTTTIITVTRIDLKERIELLISNDGVPIPLELHDKIFERGYTTKKGNTGLGLAIVKKLVEAHGWQINIEPLPETTFKISIPIKVHI